MSWAETKKINSNLSKSLDTLIGEKTTEIKNSVSAKGVTFTDIVNSREMPTTESACYTVSGISGYIIMASNASNSAWVWVGPKTFDGRQYMWATYDGSKNPTVVVPIAKNYEYNIYGNSSVRFSIISIS